MRSAHWDDAAQKWTLTAGPSEDKTVTVTAQHVIFCLGFASKVNIPKIPGMEKFKGRIVHTGEWEESIDCTGKKVAVIGTGASGIQVSQEIGPLVDRLTVFVRTPNLALPMRQQKLEASAQEAFKDIYPEIFEKRKKTFGGFHYDFDPRETLSVSAEERERLYEELWARGGFHFWLETFHDLYANKEANKTAYDFWQKKVAERIKDPKKREILCPEEWPHTFGTVRPSLEQNYYEVMNQDNVEIVSIKRGGDEGIKEITETGVRLNSGREIELDQIILATGFDTHTGGFKQIDIRGKQGLPLTDKWSQGCNSLNGLNTAVSLDITSNTCQPDDFDTTFSVHLFWALLLNPCRNSRISSSCMDLMVLRHTRMVPPPSRCRPSGCASSSSTCATTRSRHSTSTARPKPNLASTSTSSRPRRSSTRATAGTWAATSQASRSRRSISP